MGENIQRSTREGLYSAGIAACYLAAFWGRFGINIFQFAGLSGFASLAMYPLMTAIGINILAFLALGIGRKSESAPNTDRSPTFFWRVANKYLHIWETFGPVVALILVVAISAPEKWFALLFLLAPWIRRLADLPYFAQILPEFKLRLRTVYWLVAFPVLTIGLGASNADLYFSGDESRIVAATGAATGLQWDQEHPIGYLGFAGGTYFLFEGKTGSVIMLNQAVAGPLTIQVNSPNGRQRKPPEWRRNLLHSLASVHL
ncbi:hypothetical protein P0D71_18350 [Paraburkholderia sp. RL17-383-BIF-A]|uniref:hypothetical protein n=1 Tax=Paraburkholderia sp. RL17-383-BIF-A TaxID=3031631 RepID=UPI0038B946C2